MKRVLNIHASLRQKYARGNQLWNKFLKDRSEENEKKYSKQHNYCVLFLRKSKSGYFVFRKS